MGEAGFWDDNEAAQRVVSELKGLKTVVAPMNDLTSSSEDLEVLFEMVDEDASVRTEVETELSRLENLLEVLELKALLNGPNDSAGAILTINARDGGTDANDWADMMLRMYSAWAVDHSYSIELLDRQENEEAGINHASIAIRGPMAYGYLKGEEGMHRLVRISPFNSEGKRQTSFAAVSVSPEIDDSIEIDIQEKDVREDRYRAGGAGGQHVNKTDSAVRLTHLPTNIVVQCQNDRSQHKNKDQAMKLLKAKLYEFELQKQNAEKQALEDTKSDIGWGSQIRSYVLAPYRMVKDHRTSHEVSNADAVLDGDLDGFAEAYLLAKSAGEV